MLATMVCRTQGDAMPISNFQADTLAASMIDMRGFHAAFAQAVAIGGARTATEPLAKAVSYSPCGARCVFAAG